MSDHSEITIERQQLDPQDLGQALQIARRSSQLPDVHSLAGLDSSPAALLSNGWFQPIGEFADFESTEIADQLLDGIHRFDGELYSVPMFSGRRSEERRVGKECRSGGARLHWKMTTRGSTAGRSKAEVWG